MFSAFEKVLQNFLPSSPGGAHPDDPELQNKIQVATCIFFVLMANADDDFSDIEERKIYSLMKQTFHLEDSTISEIISNSETLLQTNEQITIYTDFINKHFHFDEKYELVKNLWILIFADASLHKKEEKLVHKIAKRLKVDRMMLEEAKNDAKLEAL